VANDGFYGREVWYPLPTGELLLGEGHRSYAVHLVSRAGDTLRTYARPVSPEVLDFDDGLETMRGFVTHAFYDTFREEVLLCRTRARGKGPLEPVIVDYFALRGGYLGTLEWPQCPHHVTQDGMLLVLHLGLPGGPRFPTVRGYRYAGVAGTELPTR
jgi:hypothetical protein